MWYSWNLIIILYFTYCEQCHGAFRLKDLQASYSEAYPKRQYISQNFTKGVQNVNTQKVDSLTWRRCQEPSEFSPGQFERLKKYYGQDFVLNATIENMLHQPRARIFSGNNYDTTSQDYHIAIAGPGGCYNLQQVKLGGLIKTWGKCIRVFESPHCTEISFAFYPGSEAPQINREKSEFTTISSIGPCLRDEFSSSSLRGDKVEVVKNPYLKDHNPDTILFGILDAGITIVRTPGTDELSHAFYLLDSTNRVQHIYAIIGSGSIDNGKTNKTWTSIENFHSHEIEEGDVLCYFIPPRFGGTSNQSWNLFPGSKSTAQFWATVSSKFPTPTAGLNIDLEMSVLPVYQPNHTRPLLFYYYVKSNGFMSYGRVLNGHQNNSVAVMSFFFSADTTHSKSAWKRIDWLKKLLRKITCAGNSTVQNANSPHVNPSCSMCSGEAQKYLYSLQENIFQHDFDSMKAESAALQSMVTNPVVRFYAGDNHTGDFEDFVIAKRPVGTCYKLTNLKNRVKSIATFGTCIRIFMVDNCMSASILIHPKLPKESANYQMLQIYNLSEIVSVGLCLPGEISSNESENLDRENIFPPFPSFLDTIKLDSAVDISDGSIKHLKLGQQNRTEFILAWINPASYFNLLNFHDEESPVCFDDKDSQRVCYIIPPILNGPTNQIYNTFEASQEAMSEWREIISQFLVKRNANSLFSVSFEYDEANSTKPISLSYYINEPLRGIFYGQVYNGLRLKSPHLYRGMHWSGFSSDFPYIYYKLLPTEH